ncbi:hypothetical protein [Deinococcus sp. ME38]|uniref:hypothetical protein n=1 Tax=Deinococcus sp. ME38 TaxID=3400344 RepID=UPI003B5CDF7E
MGDQTRLCDPTALLNNLEAYWQERCLPEHLLHSTVQSHPSNPSEAHYSMNVVLPNGSTLDVHEVYWAPKSPNVEASAVLKWMRKQVLVPLLRLHADWMELRRLKLGVLGQTVTTGLISSEEAIFEEARYENLLRGGDTAKFPRIGTPMIFATLIRSAVFGDKDRLPHAKWQATAIGNDWTAIWVIMSMILATLVFALFVTEAVVGLAQFFQQEPLSKWAARYGLSYGNLVDVWYISPLIAMSVVMTLAWVFGIRPFFSKYMGDVVQWATYQETDEGFKVRKAILDTSSDVFRYVLRIPGADSQKNSGLPYHRVIVMAHSLGSVIAHDTLLTLKRDHPANLEKISDFITYGSPIDKFAYFFEALQGQSPRYVKTIHQLRGELFKGRTKPLIWQNFYEEGDPIGGTIHTTGPSWAAPDIPLTSEIRNIYTANANVALVAPNHTGYIQNKLVLFRVWNALMPGILPDTPPKVNEVISPTDRQEHTDVDVMAHTRWMRQMYAVILLIPWVLLASYIAHGAHLIQLQVHQIALGAASDALRWIIVGGAVVSVVLLAISFWKPVHLLKPLAIALTALTLTGIYAALTTPGKTFWTDVPTKTAKANTDAPVAKEQKCESTFSGTEQKFKLDSTCSTPKPPQYTPALAAWVQEQKKWSPFAWIPWIPRTPWILWSSALVGLITPALLAAALLLATKDKSMKHDTKLEAQTHEPPNTLLPRIIGILIAFIAVSSAAFPDGQAILPWWWWRTTLLYATFSLIIVGLVQYIWPKRKLTHMLNP